MGSEVVEVKDGEVRPGMSMVHSRELEDDSCVAPWPPGDYRA